MSEWGLRQGLLGGSTTFPTFGYEGLGLSVADGLATVEAVNVRFYTARAE